MSGSQQVTINVIEDNTTIQQFVPYKDEATPDSFPTSWVNGASNLFERYLVKLPGDYINYKDDNNNHIVITQEELDVNFVEIWVKNGIAKKFLSAKAQPINNITQNITQNIVEASQLVPSDKTYNTEIDGNPELATDIVFKVDKLTGQNVNYRKTTNYYDGSIMQDSKVDGYIYKKIDGVYYEKIINRIGDNIDIREFNIVNDATLDQSFYLDYLAYYCDKNEIYEINFLNYHIMTSKKLLLTTNRPTQVRGLGFKKAHRIKNLNIYNDKSKQLKQGQCCIVFHPTKNDTTTFELDNVNFDPYVSNYHVSNGEYDGMMVGFLVYNDPTWNYVNNEYTGYSFKFNNINFLSPAVSYNIATSSIFAKNVIANKLSGEYLGLYMFIFAKDTYIDEIEGVFRDDYYTNSGRVLVTNLIHYEAETHSNSVVQNELKVLNAKCVKKTTESQHIVFKQHSIGSHSYKAMSFKNIRGNIDLYDPKNSTTNISSKTNLLIVEDLIGGLTIQFSASKIEIKNSTLLSSSICNRYNSLIEELTITNSYIGNISLFGDSAGIIKNLNLIETTIVKNNITDDYGFIRNTNIKVENLYGNNIKLHCQRFIECDFDKVFIDGFRMFDNSFMNTFFLNSTQTKIAKLTLKNIDAEISTIPQWTYFIMGTSTAKIDVLMYNSNTGKRLPIICNSKKEWGVFPIEKGPTDQRPTLSSDDVGCQYYDETVGKLMCWNGADWV